MTDYSTISSGELTSRLAALNAEFDEYKPIYVEVYGNMVRISEEAAKIKEELSKRNGTDNNLQAV
jgi:hypothetical protein